MATARAAGASADAVAGLVAEAAEARRVAADGRPLGARLDSARAQLARAERKLTATEEALAAAAARRDAATRDLEEARAALQDLEAEVARAPQVQAERPEVAPSNLNDDKLAEAHAENQSLRALLATLRGEQSLDDYAVATYGAGAEAKDASSDDDLSVDGSCAPARTRRGAPEGGRAGSEPPALRRRDGSASRTPPPPRLGAGRLPVQLAWRR